jgi:hypothetical protein
MKREELQERVSAWLDLGLSALAVVMLALLVAELALSLIGYLTARVAVFLLGGPVHSQEVSESETLQEVRRLR